MHAAEGPAWALAVEHTALGEAMRGGVLLYPIVETGHILGFASLIGSILVLDLRLIGIGRGIRPAALIRIAVPVAACGLLLAAATGSALFVTEATSYVRNPAFYLKQALIVLGLVNVAVFHRTLMPAAGSWPEDVPPPLPARLAAALSALTWIGVLVCGRFIAYV
jgi:hypothetical protein